ncbi:MAG TPA: glycoside hydrolase family 2 TIM barrel-domain containing protein [Sedimentisphaerales bacterium]|nr:glycoside hydrolase family 2 TIM barrel-domain containing protein [Sedimentisphaerales bacterium]HRS11792.1 glycoside hydrolase family 2 TIM barrel-domain containing protein [Sedimentisphaerales bacterium]HRV48453.1 glycoside hydrolase family 2 TIM barrel-domain containing protein [Sedimentisphaerales bacterium]
MLTSHASICVVYLTIACVAAAGAISEDAALPPGVQPVWDISTAYREATATRERVCINGLWRWQPAQTDSESAADVPQANWGYFKVPGCWPGITDYMQKDSQTVHSHPSWRDCALRDVAAAWYEREITIPSSWAGRHISLCLEYLNSYAAVYVDRVQAGEARFPGGELDLTAFCRPGRTHRLSLLVVAMPLKGVMLSYIDTASAREVKGTVARRGLCGDVYLIGMPAGPRITDARVATSIRRQQISLDLALEGLEARNEYAVGVRILDQDRVVKEFTGRPFRAGDVREGRITCTDMWMPDKLWDLHTPQNTYDAEVSLLDMQGHVLDTHWPIRFGFREMWIEGRDFYLNGTRIFLSAVPLDNAQVGAASATYEAARESLERLKSFGINFVYTHNYGCEPGSHLSFAEILRAADDTGMLVSFSQPHFSHYDWQAPDADRDNGYARHAEFYVRVAQNHPSVVMYSMSHNATGYNEDMNPDMIDGLQDARDNWALRNVKLAMRAEAIVRTLDPSRIVYHHASGNLGSMHAINFYPNFVPVQEMSDWFAHWATRGIKPVFLCEYGTPFTWDWAMYRGWYEGKREFGSAAVPWEFCLAEWNAQFLGDRAFAISEMEKRNLRWEAQQFRAGRLWHRWDYPHQLGSTDFPEREPVFSLYLTDNWRAFRTWGVSAISPWEHHILFKLRPGVDRNHREEFEVDWRNLQRPGFSPDYREQRYERMDLAYERADWVPTGAGNAILRNNQPLLAYIAGKAGSFTSKDHNFTAGQTVEKQLIVINNSRQPVRCACSWHIGLPEPVAGHEEVTVETGQQTRVPIRFVIPTNAKPGSYEMIARAVFSSGQSQEDTFTIHVVPQPAPVRNGVRVAIFDPRGETAQLMEDMGLSWERVDATADLASYEVLVVGKAVLTVDGAAPDISRVRDGLKVVVFEQTPEVLEKRFGFRVAEYGLRNVFPRVPDHPVLAGLEVENLRDWRGEATIIPPRLKYERSAKFNGAPAVTWCGLTVTRAWRCGNRGNVVSVLIEKPACGDFLPIVDGGFSLQYSPLMEYREGKGMVLFCQMDVTGRTETEPVAEILVANLLRYVGDWKPAALRKAFYAGATAGREHLEAAGFPLHAYEGGEIPTDSVLILGPQSEALSAQRDAIGVFLASGGRVLAVGLAQEDVDTVLPVRVTMRQAEHINAFFDPATMDAPLAGIGPADVHCRDPRTLALVSGGAEPVGDGVLAVAPGGKVVFCQLVPWRFEYRSNFGLKRTFRRSSFLVTRLLANLGAQAQTPLLGRFSRPVEGDEPGRWLQGLYLDEPQEWDDPYRFFRW